MAKIKLKAGDEVYVITGKAASDKPAVIVKVDRKKERVAVEGRNVIKKAIRRSQAHPNGGIVEMEGFIHVSNVMTKAEYEARRANRKG